MTEIETPTAQRIAFGHLEVEYDERVLAPRPWTEAQSTWSAELLAALPPGDVLELCSGAGHIGLLAIAGTSRHLVQVDAAEVACAFAAANAEAAEAAAAATADTTGHGARWSVEVRHGWFEEALAPAERFALVIADPPWVPAHETGLHPGDPLTAIDGGSDGLDAVRSCLEVIGRHLFPQGAAVLQLGDLGQAEAVTRHLEQRPDLDLRVVEQRAYDGGAIVHLARLPVGATG